MMQRRGSMLFELVVAMSAMMAVLAMAIGLIHQTMHGHRRSSQILEVERSALRLARQIRLDAREAVHASIETIPEFVLRMDVTNGRSFSYRWTAEGCRWHEKQNGTLVRREFFPYPADESSLVIALTRDSTARLRVTIAPDWQRFGTAESESRDSGSKVARSIAHATPMTLQVVTTLPNCDAANSLEWEYVR